MKKFSSILLSSIGTNTFHINTIMGMKIKNNENATRTGIKKILSVKTGCRMSFTAYVNKIVNITRMNPKIHVTIMY